MKRFGKKEVLSEISFTLKTGEILGVFGRNGCGKSTLLKILFGALKADYIDAAINNQPFLPSKNIKNKLLAYLPQHSFLPKELKVRDAIPIYFEDDEKKQDAIFYDPIIAKIAAAKIGTLSAGQQRYLEVLLIGSLPHPFILLDEPFSMMDPMCKIEIKKFLKKRSEEKGVLITDHYYADVLEIAHKNMLITQGTSHIVTNPEQLKTLGYLSK